MIQLMHGAYPEITKPTIGSLFAGIGGIDLGFERAGFNTTWRVETNPFSGQILEKNFPNANRNLEAVTC